jgi:hypothetical protein
MEITFFCNDYKKALQVVSGRKHREWIDQTNLDYYNDLSLTMANESGWVFRAPDEFTIEWNGGPDSEDLSVHSFTKDAHLFYTGMGNGICSIRTGYVVRTPEDYAILSTGAPNFFVDGAVQLTNLIESNWAHMTFFLNWKMTRPGKVTFKKNDPIGFITLIPHRQLDNVDFKIDSILSDLELFKAYKNWESTPVDLDPYREGIIDNETLEKTDKFHIQNRKLKTPENNLTEGQK